MGYVLIELFNEDCIQAMKKIPDGSIDLTVTSPPYDNLRTYKDSLEWGEHIWKQVIAELYRLTKAGGVVVWVVGDATVKGSETGTSFKQALWAIESGFNLHDTMIYKKGNKPPLSHPRYEQAFEYMFILSNGRPTSVNLLTQPCIHAGKINTGTARHSVSDNLSQKHGSGKPCQETKPLGNIWTYNVGNVCNSAKINHPAKFPEQLAHDHILSWSNEGDTVFDPFMGSGTTGKMAAQLKRNFIGIEKVPEYFDIAHDRIEAETKQVAMF